MILNIDNLSVSMRNAWAELAASLEKLGYDIKVFSGSKGAKVFAKETGAEIGEISAETVADEEIDYILYSRLNLKRKAEGSGC